MVDCTVIMSHLFKFRHTEPVEFLLLLLGQLGFVFSMRRLLQGQTTNSPSTRRGSIGGVTLLALGGEGVQRRGGKGEGC